MQIFIISLLLSLCCSILTASINISPCAKWNTTGITVAGNGKPGNSFDQLSDPHGIFIHRQTNMLYVADTNNNRIQIFSLDQPSNIGTSVVSFVRGPRRIYVDDDENGPTIYVTSIYPAFVLKYVNGTSVGEQVGNDWFTFSGISIDMEKNIYLTQKYYHIVTKWSPLTNCTTVIAGQTGVFDSSSTSLDTPEGIYLDQTRGAVYIADANNHRIQKWVKDAQEGVTVAGSSEGLPGADPASLMMPFDVFVDEETNVVYTADTYNYRIQRQLPDASKGDTIAGGFGSGNANNAFRRPVALAFDSKGNLFVSDSDNHRVQMFALIDNRSCSAMSTGSSVHKITMTMFVLSIFTWIISRLL